MWILLSPPLLPGYQRAGNCRSRESQSSGQADLFVTICEAFDSAFYGCDAWFESSPPRLPWLKKQSLRQSVRLQPLNATQTQTSAQQASLTFFTPAIPQPHHTNPPQSRSPTPWACPLLLPFLVGRLTPTAVCKFTVWSAKGLHLTRSASWGSLMNWLMIHYIQSQLSMSKEVSVPWLNYHRVHDDRTD